MHHSPDEEATKTDQPFSKVQRTPVARKRLVIPALAMSPSSKPDSKQRVQPLQINAKKFMSFENYPQDQQPVLDQEAMALDN